MAIDIETEIAQALKRAREWAHMSPGEFAAAIHKVSGGDYPLVSGDTVVNLETGMRDCDATYLVAAARVVSQPVSSILGELELYEGTIPRLEAELRDLKDMISRIPGLRAG